MKGEVALDLTLRRSTEARRPPMLPYVVLATEALDLSRDVAAVGMCITSTTTSTCA